MQKLNKPTNYNTFWSQNGSRVEVDSKQPIGWEVEIPKREVMNGLQYRQDYAIGYLLQNGVPDYDANSTYYTGQISNLSGVLYKAKRQVQGISPTTHPDRETFWEKVAPTWGEYLTVFNRINSADPFTQYILKSNPQTDRVYTGAGLRSNMNNALQLVFDGGLKYKVGATVQYQFSEVDIPVEDSSKNIATTEWVHKLIAQLRTSLEVAVGESIITTSSTNPAFTKGYGVWELDCQGKSLVGVSQISSDPSWTKAPNSTFGQYDVVLALAQMPKHNHYTDSRFRLLTAMSDEIYSDASIRQQTSSGYDYVNREEELGIGRITSKAKSLMQMADAGSGQAHNNVQPSQTKYIWTRVA